MRLKVIINDIPDSVSNDELAKAAARLAANWPNAYVDTWTVIISKD